MNHIMSILTDKFGSKENTILGAVIDDSLKQHIEICVLGTTDVASKKYTRPKKRVPAAPQPIEDVPELELSELKVTTASASKHATQRVHESKLGKRKKSDELLKDQEEFRFVAEEEQRGYFDDSPKNVYQDQDLDIPAYIRRGVKIHC